MNKIFKTFIYSFCFINFVFILVTFIPPRTNAILPIINPINTEEVSAGNLIQAESQSQDQIDYKEYNILLLGLDGRRGDAKARCDAIHIFSFSPSNDKLIITSIPRGTKIDMPNVSTQSAYLANNCHINGIENTILEIEKIADLRIDAHVIVGFSQALGILRSMNIPTTSTLQYLRNRRYAIGDNQRSHNQAIFFQDMILAYFEHFYKLPNSLKQFLFNSVDTNLSFDTASYLMNEFYGKKIFQDPEKIILITKPERSPYVKELHYEMNLNTEQNTENDMEYILYQQTIENYLNNLVLNGENKLKAGNKIAAYSQLKTPFHQKLWLQLENEDIRDRIHFNLFRVYRESMMDQNDQGKLTDDFIFEMKLFNKTEYVEKALELVGEIYQWANLN